VITKLLLEHWKKNNNQQPLKVLPFSLFFLIFFISFAFVFVFVSLFLLLLLLFLFLLLSSFS
jgi:hypothetical protein